MDSLLVHVEGLGWWSPGVADWNAAAPLLRDDAAFPFDANARPAASVLPSNERRRAPEAVLIACDVAAQACAMAARDPASLPCVFVSAHGDLPTTDSLCATLAADPLQVSPTKFHNSVHNAPAGYWTVATHCHAASSAVSGWHTSLAAGLFEAAVQAHADATPVLFAAYDIAAIGPFIGTVAAPSAFGAALVLTAERSARTCVSLRLRHAPTLPDSAARADAAPRREPLLATHALFAALARAKDGEVHLPSGASSTLIIEVCA
ncbi:MAG: beta-ketoacyl synthase chain length factor [Dokdonella sp.]